MPRTYELTTELASLRSNWRELDRAKGELPEGAHIQGLMRFTMTWLDDRIMVLERKMSLTDADQACRLGAAA